MKAIIVILFLLLAPGLYLILSSALKLPSRRAGRAMKSYGADKKRGISESIDSHLAGVSAKASKYIRINEYKRERLVGILQAVGDDRTPEEFTAHVWLKSLMFLIPVIPMFYIFPVVNIALILLSVLTYFREAGRPDELLRAKRERIEAELYRFVATIREELKSNHDVLSILENYKRSAGEEFAHELIVLCGDMRSSNYETALSRFCTKFNSPQLDDVVKGLIGVLRGDKSEQYFENLSYSFKEMELQRLKAKASKIPGKVRKFSFIMLACYVCTFFVIIIYEILNSLGTMF